MNLNSNFNIHKINFQNMCTNFVHFSNNIGCHPNSQKKFYLYIYIYINKIKKFPRAEPLASLSFGVLLLISLLGVVLGVGYRRLGGVQFRDTSLPRLPGWARLGRCGCQQSKNGEVQRLSQLAKFRKIRGWLAINLW